MHDNLEAVSRLQRVINCAFTEYVSTFQARNPDWFPGAVMRLVFFALKTLCKSIEDDSSQEVSQDSLRVEVRKSLGGVPRQDNVLDLGRVLPSDLCSELSVEMLMKRCLDRLVDYRAISELTSGFRRIVGPDRTVVVVPEGHSAGLALHRDWLMQCNPEKLAAELRFSFTNDEDADADNSAEQAGELCVSFYIPTIDPTDGSSYLPIWVGLDFSCAEKAPPRRDQLLSICQSLLVEFRDFIPWEDSDASHPDYAEIVRQACKVESDHVFGMFLPEDILHSEGNVFTKHGPLWWIRFEGEWMQTPDSVGMKYIHFLLSHPKETFTAIEVVHSGVLPVATADNTSSEDPEQQLTRRRTIGPKRHNDFDEVDAEMDDTSIQQTVKRLRQLDQLIANRAEDSTKVAKWQEEKRCIQRYLRGSIGLRGRIREFSGQDEKARRAVNKAINSALEQIRSQHEGLWQHLFGNIKRSDTCNYTPHGAGPWTT
jgi:hypothetical protein